MLNTACPYMEIPRFRNGARSGQMVTTRGRAGGPGLGRWLGRGGNIHEWSQKWPDGDDQREGWRPGTEALARKRWEGLSGVVEASCILARTVAARLTLVTTRQHVLD